MIRVLLGIALSIFVVAAPVAIHAQERPAPLSVPACTEELFENAETSFRMRRRGSGALFKAERELKEVVSRCAETPGAYQAAEHLKVTQEELANSRFHVAVFYLDRFAAGKGGKQGALARLKDIVDKYPQYSKLDQVLSLLGKMNIADGNPDEAAIYYCRLIKDFPGSEYVGEASLALKAIEAMKIEKGPIPRP